MYYNYSDYEFYPPRNVYNDKNWGSVNNNCQQYGPKAITNNQMNFPPPRGPQMHFQPRRPFRYPYSSTIRPRVFKPSKRKRSHLDDVFRKNGEELDEYRSRPHTLRYLEAVNSSAKEVREDYLFNAKKYKKNYNNINKCPDITERFGDKSNKSDVLQTCKKIDKKEPKNCTVSKNSNCNENVPINKIAVNNNISLDIFSNNRGDNLECQEVVNSNLSTNNLEVQIILEEKNKPKNEDTIKNSQVFSENDITATLNASFKRDKSKSPDISTTKPFVHNNNFVKKTVSIPFLDDKDNQLHTTSPPSPFPLIINSPPLTDSQILNEQNIVNSQKLRQIDSTVDLNYAISIDTIDTKKSYSQNDKLDGNCRHVDTVVGSSSPHSWNIESNQLCSTKVLKRNIKSKQPSSPNSKISKLQKNSIHTKQNDENTKITKEKMIIADNNMKAPEEIEQRKRAIENKTPKNVGVHHKPDIKKRHISIESKSRLEQKSKGRKDKHYIDDVYFKKRMGTNKSKVDRHIISDKKNDNFLASYIIPKVQAQISDNPPGVKKMNYLFDNDDDDIKQSKQMYVNFEQERKRRRESSDSTDSDNTRNSIFRESKRYKQKHCTIKQKDENNKEIKVSLKNPNITKLPVCCPQETELRKSDNDQSIKNNEKIISFVEKYAVPQITDIVIEKFLPLPVFTFPSLFRISRHNIVSDDCTDEAVILDTPNIQETVEIIKSKTKDLEDVIEIKDDIPIIDLTEDKPKNVTNELELITVKQNELSVTDIKIETKLGNDEPKNSYNNELDEKIINILEQPKLSDETITLYRGEQTLNCSLDIQATSISIMTGNSDSFKDKKFMKSEEYSKKAENDSVKLINVDSVELKTIDDVTTVDEEEAVALPVVDGSINSSDTEIFRDSIKNVSEENSDNDNTAQTEIVIQQTQIQNYPLDNVSVNFEGTSSVVNNSAVSNNISARMDYPQKPIASAINQIPVLNNNKTSVSEVVAVSNCNTSYIQSITNSNTPLVANEVSIPNTSRSILPTISDQNVLQVNESVNTLQSLLSFSHCFSQTSESQSIIKAPYRSSIQQTGVYNRLTTTQMYSSNFNITLIANTIMEYVCFYHCIKNAEIAYETTMKVNYKVIPVLVKAELLTFSMEQKKKLEVVSKSLTEHLRRLPTLQKVDLRFFVNCILFDIQRKFKEFTETWFFIILNQLMDSQKEFYNSNPFLKPLYEYVRLHAEKIYFVGNRNQLQQNTFRRPGLDPQQRSTLENQIAQYQALRVSSQNNVMQKHQAHQTNTVIPHPVTCQAVSISTTEPEKITLSNLLQSQHPESNLHQGGVSTGCKINSNLLIQTNTTQSNNKSINFNTCLPSSVPNTVCPINSKHIQSSVHLSNTSTHTSVMKKVSQITQHVQNSILSSTHKSPLQETINHNQNSIFNTIGIQKPYKQHLFQISSHNNVVVTSPTHILTGNQTKTIHITTPSEKSTDINVIKSSMKQSNMSAIPLPPSYNSNMRFLIPKLQNTSIKSIPGNSTESCSYSNNYLIHENSLTQSVSTPKPTLSVGTSTNEPSTSNFTKPPIIEIQKSPFLNIETLSTEDMSTNVSSESSSDGSSISALNTLSTPVCAPILLSSSSHTDDQEDLYEIRMTEPSDSNIIDLTWINDVDPEQIQKEISLVIKEEVIEEDGEEVILNQEQFPDAPSPHIGISSPFIKEDSHELVQIERRCICEKPSEYVCGCRMAMYCSNICQQKDWKVHKAICLKYTSQK